ncbi:MAG: hypothetical protein WC819_00150 [Parcubacteria group bacterium]|jgi:hypothetical protein
MPEKMSPVGQYKWVRKPFEVTEEMREGAQKLEEEESIRSGDIGPIHETMCPTKKQIARNDAILTEEGKMIKSHDHENK